MPCGSTFSIHVRDRRNMLNYNRYNAKSSVLKFLASRFGIKIQSINHIYSNPLLGHHFSRFMFILSKNVYFGGPFKSSGRQNPPTPIGVMRCQTRECRIIQNGQNLSLVTQPGLWHYPIMSFLDPVPRLRAAKNLIWGLGGAPFCQHLKNSKIQACQNPSKSQKITPWTLNASILMTCWCHLYLRFR